MDLDGRLVDLDTPIQRDAKVRIVTTRDAEALEIMRHSAAHVMAQAILRLYPEAKLTIGPVVEDGLLLRHRHAAGLRGGLPPHRGRDPEDLIKAKLPIRRREVTKAEALDALPEEPYKLEMIQDLHGRHHFASTSRASSPTSAAGPHVPHTGFVKAIKLLKVSGAYWRADPARAQLQRIYGTAYFDKKELDAYLTFLEEAKRRNHRKIGQALDLFSFHDEAPGMPFFHPKGMVIWNALLDYWRMEHRAAGYVETKTPIILNRALWERSGHWANYRENMYTTTIDEMEYAIKPMNCPGGMLLYNRKPHSYRDLPLRAAEIGLVHRHELSGVLSGLFRVRAFHQDDAHIFMTPDADRAGDPGGAAPGRAHLQHLRPGLSPRAVDAAEEIDRHRRAVGAGHQRPEIGARRAYGQDYKLNEGDGAFYGPKIDIHIKDALGRTWQCGTIQLDMSLPERFNLHFVDTDNERKRPIMIHRVIYGSIERFLGILVEHFAGRFPLWMSPVQAVILPMNDELAAYAEEVKARFDAAGLRTEVDSRTESLNQKVREAQLVQHAAHPHHRRARRKTPGRWR